MRHIVSYTGSNPLYAFLRRKADLYVQSGTNFVLFNSSNLTDYAISPSSISGDLYTFDFPDPALGDYIVQVYEKTTSDPLPEDPGSSQEIYFNGTIGTPLTVDPTQFYGSLEGANFYFQSRLHSTSWFDFSDADKVLALKSATAAIDRIGFCGWKTSPTQVLEFPRNGQTEVPGQIIMATYEESFQLLTDGPVSKQASKMEVTSRQFSSIRTTYARGTVLDTERLRWGIGSPLAWLLLQPFICRNRTVRLHRVS